MGPFLVGLSGVDFARLRSERLAKLQAQMRSQNVGSLLLLSPVGIRYATGTSMMTLWTAMNLSRYAVIPVEGDPVVFEYAEGVERARKIWPNSRPCLEWQARFSQQRVLETRKRWAEEIYGVLTELGLQNERMGYDILDHHGVEALKACGLELTDADGPMQAASHTKTQDEIVLLRQSCAVAESALYDLQNAIRPGVSENELLAIFWKGLLEKGGEYCSTRLLTSGEKTNPWFQEAGERIVRPGDLVALDTDMKGPEGYLCDISRTYLCGDRASADQKEAHRVAYDFVQFMVEQCVPGKAFADVHKEAPQIPEPYQEQAYSCMIHGCGLDDESPFVPYAHVLKGTVPDGEIQKDMVLSIEFYAGKVGARDGVKLEEQLLVTDSGPELLARAPFDENLLH